MSGGVIALRSLSGQLLPGAESSRCLALEVHALVLGIHREALRLLVEPRGLEVTIEAGHLVMSAQWKSIPVQVRLSPAVTSEGYLRLEVASIRAASFLPLPAGLAGRVLEQARGKPGVVRTDSTSLDLDIAAAVTSCGTDRLRLPPLSRVTALDEWIELEFGPQRREEPL